jgi:hypothetical protein
MTTNPVQLRSLPGIKRDGTKFEGNQYVDGQWVRFQRGLPRKIGGYRQISNFANGIVRQFYTQALNNSVYTHIGTASGVQAFTLDYDGNASAPIDRTPSGFVGDDNYAWNFDSIFDGAGGGTVIVANATNTLDDISDATPLPIWIGDIYGTAPLTPIIDAVKGPILASGNICALHPYLFVMGDNGYIRWSDANDPTNFSSGDAGDAYIASSKLVKGLPLRGGSQNPAGILWTLDSVIRVSYTGGNDVFSFDTITASTSVLATNGIIEYDGIFFWAALDRFMMYNGVVKEVENNINLNYFYDGLNYKYANKVFAMKVPRFGEIWWCYPRGNATECTHAVIYNVRENTWYDTELPNGGRSAGIYAQVFRSPLMAGVEAIPANAPDYRITQSSNYRITEDGDYRVTEYGSDTYKIWRHEIGTNEIDGQQINAIQSYFETSDLTMVVSDDPKNFALGIKCIEPDFVQSGDMSVQIVGRINARAQEVYGPKMVFPAVAEQPDEELVFFKEQRRELRFRFESNTVDGDYQMGQILVHIEQGDGRMRS